MNDMFGYAWGRIQGQQEEAFAHSPPEPAWLTPMGQGHDVGKSIALEAEVAGLKSDVSNLQEENSHLEKKCAAQEARNAYLEKTLEDTRRRLNAARAVRDTLRNALAQVAPDHQYINPLSKNPLLVQVANAGYQADLDTESK